MKILITGASGFLGRHISRALIREGHQLVAVSRQAGVDFRSMRSASDWRVWLDDMDAVINCAGIIAERGGNSFAAIHTAAPSALFDACVEQGVKRVIQISALGVEHANPTPYQSSKAQADRHLQTLPLDWFILRPSLVYGPEGSSTRFFTRLASLPVVPLIAQGQQCVQPVHVDDVVATILQCLSVSTAQQIINVVGPEQLSFAEWLLRLRHQSGKGRAATISVPYAVVSRFAFLLSPFLQLMNADNLRMLQQGNCADVQPLIQFLGRKPHVVP